jgi:hypothetical protein
MKKTNVIAATLLATSAATASSQTINVNDIELTTSGEIKYHGELGEFDRKVQGKGANSQIIAACGLVCCNGGKER